MAYPSGRKNKRLVTINGAQFGYGSYEHYKVYQRAIKHRNETKVPKIEQNQVEKQKVIHKDGVQTKCGQLKDDVVLSDDISINS